MQLSLLTLAVRCAACLRVQVCQWSHTTGLEAPSIDAGRASKPPKDLNMHWLHAGSRRKRGLPATGCGPADAMNHIPLEKSQTIPEPKDIRQRLSDFPENP
eukprot:1978494-Amphidinium_carterae.1